MKSICEVTRKHFVQLTDLWEASVRSSHYFLSEEDIKFLRKKILNNFLKAVTLRACKDELGQIQGFIGVSQRKIEMLFISPHYRCKGIGKMLLTYAIKHMKATELDVNEQNPQAIGFYKHMGFQVIGRSPLDGFGKPFPLLHMKLKTFKKKIQRT